MTNEIVIGIPGDEDLSALAARLSNLLGVPFEERESSHYGGGYYLAQPSGDEEIRLYRNYDPLDGAPFFENARDCPALLRVFFTERDVDELTERIRAQVHPATRILRRHP